MNHYMPHGHCYLWQPGLVWTHVISDSVVALSYFAIAVGLYLLVKRTRTRFSAVVLAFGLFIFACGLTHAVEVWNLWNADYWFGGWVKVVTATASLTTAIWLYRLSPELINGVNAAMLSGRRRLQLEELARDLETRVAERTSELEKNRFEAQQRALEIQQITDLLPALVAYLDRDQRYKMVNSAYVSWFGIAREKIIGQHIRELIGDEVFESVQIYLQRAYQGESQTFQIEARYRYGGTRYMQLSYIPMFDSDHSVKGVIVLGNDLTDHQRSQHELELAKIRAEEASRAKTEFLANMSHEIRTPLGAVMGFADLLSGQDLSPQEREDYSEIVSRNGRQLSNLINDILDLSKVEAGKMEIEHISVSVRELIDDVILSLRAAAEAKELLLKAQISSEVPIYVRTDPTRLKQILLNLVGNSIKFTDKGSVIVSCEMSHFDELGRRRMIIRVSDTGIGIPIDKQAKLFQPFAQADSSMSRKYGGTGLGLALSNQLAAALSGELKLVQSAPTQGSTFQLALDVTDRSATRLQVPLGTPQNPKEPRLGHISILVVDDSKDNQLLVSRILGSEGAQMGFANNGAEAIEKASQHSYDLILMDVQMPEMNGYEATQMLRKHGFQKPIISLTAHALREDYERSRKAGCDDHLTKPLDRDKLIETIVRWSGHERGAGRA